MKNISYILGIGLVLCCIGMIKLSVSTTHVEEQIKIHNSIQETNAMFPTISKPPSSQSTVYQGDSVRIRKIDSIR
jgi:hypothetical protein